MAYVLYVQRNGKTEAYASFADPFHFVACAARYRDEKGGGFTDADKVFFESVIEGVTVARGGFKKLMRALRHHDEIGLSNDLYDAMEEIESDKSITAVSFNQMGGRQTNFGEYSI